jgi:hypothetical protein
MPIADDSAVGLPLAVPSPLRIYRPPAEPAPECRPELAWARIDGFLFSLRHWDAEAWGKLPAGDRPAKSLKGNRGGRFALEAEKGVE